MPKKVPEPAGACAYSRSIEDVLEAQQDEVDARVGLADAAVGDVLQAHAEVVLPARAEARADADVVAELEVGAELPVDADVPGQDVESDRCLQVQLLLAAVLEPEHRSEREIGGAVVVVFPRPERHLPVAAEAPVAARRPFLAPLPKRRDPDRIGLLVAPANFHR